jgi:hypothetical protein
VYALQKYDFFVLFPINPTTLAKYREAFKPSRAKDDPTDTELALDLLLRHPDRFKPLRPQSVAMRTLLTLVEQRREPVGDKTRFTPHAPLWADDCYDLRDALQEVYAYLVAGYVDPKYKHQRGTA